MKVNLGALLIFVGFAVLLALALSPGQSNWFHFSEAVSTVLILAGVAGLLGRAGLLPRRRSR